MDYKDFLQNVLGGLHAKSRERQQEIGDLPETYSETAAQRRKRLAAKVARAASTVSAVAKAAEAISTSGAAAQPSQVVTQPQAVFTGLGPENARRYTSILAGHGGAAGGISTIPRVSDREPDPPQPPGSPSAQLEKYLPGAGLWDVEQLRETAKGFKLKGHATADRPALEAMLHKKLKSIASAERLAGMTPEQFTTPAELMRPTDTTWLDAQRARGAEKANAPVIAEAPAKTLQEAIARLTEAIKEASTGEPLVAKEVAGLSWGERRTRLEKTGELLGEGEVRRSTLRERVTLQDRITESERRQQHRRDERAQDRAERVTTLRQAVEKHVGGRVQSVVGAIAGERAGAAAGRWAQRHISPAVLRRATGGAAGAAVAGRGLGAATARLGGIALARFGGMALTNPVTALVAATVAVGVAFLKLPGIAERLGTSLVEGQRHLAKYNAGLMSTYTALDYQKRVLDAQQAGATSGSGSLLGRELGALRQETQWMREGFGTVKNTVGVLAVELGRLVNAVIEQNIATKLLKWSLDNLEKVFGVNMVQDTAIIDSMRAMSRYTTPRPKNMKPGKGGQD